jgi:hypothetical protein
MRGNDALRDHDRHEFVDVIDVQPCDGLGDVTLDLALGDRQAGRNLAVVQTVGEQRSDLELASGQPAARDVAGCVRAR